MDRLIRAGRLADPKTLLVEFREDESLRDIKGGGAKYLAGIARNAETIVNARDYALVVVDLALKRAVITAAEQALNHAYDPTAQESEKIIATLGDQLRTLHLELGALTNGPKSVDWSRVAHGEIPDQRWLVDQWIPLETSGVFGGRGGGGKSFLQMILMICLATGTPFLGAEIEPCPCIGLFAEETQEQLEARARKICRALQIDPECLRGRCDFRSMMGVNQPLFQAQRYDLTVTPTAWWTELLQDAKAMGDRCYLMLDHILKLMAVERNQPGQIFDLFGHLNEGSTKIRGAVCLLSHPSKADLRAAQGPQIGGCHAMLDAPRWCWLMSSHTEETLDGEKTPYRALIYEKANHGKRHAIKLTEGAHGIVEPAGDLDPDKPDVGSSRGRSRAAHEQSLEALRELFGTYRREVPLDDLVAECITRAIIAEARPETAEWRDRRRTIRKHMLKNKRFVDARDNDCFALKP